MEFVGLNPNGDLLYRDKDGREVVVPASLAPNAARDMQQGQAQQAQLEREEALGRVVDRSPEGGVKIIDTSGRIVTVPRAIASTEAMQAAEGRYIARRTPDGQTIATNPFARDIAAAEATAAAPRPTAATWQPAPLSEIQVKIITTPDGKRVELHRDAQGKVAALRPIGKKED